MDLNKVMNDVTDAIVEVDASRVPFRSFQPGVGPYGEPQLLKLIVAHLNRLPEYKATVLTKRSPDLLVPGFWAIEFKIVRPFGDNGEEAEDWSVNLLHPYAGNVSSIGDCLKLKQLPGKERKSVAVIGYEHAPPKISLSPLVESFEAICDKVIGIRLSKREENYRSGLVHRVHQAVRVFAWEVLQST
jgi:hypothetical protein